MADNKTKFWVSDFFKIFLHYWSHSKYKSQQQSVCFDDFNKKNAFS